MLSHPRIECRSYLSLLLFRLLRVVNVLLYPHYEAETMVSSFSGGVAGYRRELPPAAGAGAGAAV